MNCLMLDVFFEGYALGYKNLIIYIRVRNFASLSSGSYSSDRSCGMVYRQLRGESEIY